jgi:Ca2+-binding RTX toxin-like protein
VSIEAVAGGSGNDLILGNAGANQLIGADGDDRLVGRGGNDRLEGGIGSDTADYAEAMQSVFVDLTAGSASGVEIGTDTLFSIENVDGGFGDDSIRGDAGTNRLLGSGGADQLEGRGDADHFVYNATTDGLDHITDFSGHDGEGDVFDFNALAFGNGLAEGGADTGVLDASHFVANDTGATTADEVFWYNTGDSTLYYDADGNGGGEAVAIAVLDNGFVLNNTDLHLV